MVSMCWARGSFLAAPLGCGVGREQTLHVFAAELRRDETTTVMYISSVMCVYRRKLNFTAQTGDASKMELFARKIANFISCFTCRRVPTHCRTIFEPVFFDLCFLSLMGIHLRGNGRLSVGRGA